MDFLDNWEQKTDNARLVAQETAVLTITEYLYTSMSRAGTTEQELAEKLAIPSAKLRNMLSGKTDITIRMLADICFILKARVPINGYKHQTTTM